MRSAAASVSRITWGRGRGSAWSPAVGDSSHVVHLVQSRSNQCRHLLQALEPAHNAHHMLSTRRASSRHPARVPWRIPHHIDLDHADAGHAGDRVLHHGRQLAGRRTIRRRQRHVDVDRAIIPDVDLVDQAELVDVGRDFRIVDGLQRGHDFVGQPLGLLLRQRRMVAAGFASFGAGFFGLRSIVGHAKQFLRLDQRLRQVVDFFPGVIHPERGPARGRDVEPLQQRHHAMGAGAHRDALPVDHGGDVVRMRALHLERDHRPLVCAPCRSCAAN